MKVEESITTLLFAKSNKSLFNTVSDPNFKLITFHILCQKYKKDTKMLGMIGRSIVLQAIENVCIIKKSLKLLTKYNILEKDQELFSKLVIYLF